MTPNIVNIYLIAIKMFMMEEQTEIKVLRIADPTECRIIELSFFL